MNQAEQELLTTLREQIEHLIAGENVPAVALPEDCDGDVKGLVETFNTYLAQLDEAKTFIIALAKGNLDVITPSRNQIAAPYKQLHSSLQHLAWQTRQIAHGDYEQRVYFLGGFSESFNSMVEALAEKERTETELRDARNQVQQLEGIIPICMYCKKIRDDRESWHRMEDYISTHSQAQFSHGICPTCFDETMKKHDLQSPERSSNAEKKITI